MFRSVIHKEQVGTDIIFAWRLLMLAAVGAGGAFLLDGFAAAGSTFLWIVFISRLLCNCLLMSFTKKFDVWIGWASFGGEEGAKPKYQKICTMVKYKSWIGWVVLF